LAAEGESVILSNPNLLQVDQINYSLQTVDMGLARVPNGTGSFVIQEPTWNSNNESSMATIDFEVDNNEFAIYPNPASTYFNLSFGINLVGKNIQIFNSLGQSISEMKAASQMEIVTSSYPVGVYFVKCGNITKKVVID
jgi:hypothetical protein